MKDFEDKIGEGLRERTRLAWRCHGGRNWNDPKRHYWVRHDGDALELTYETTDLRRVLAAGSLDDIVQKVNELERHGRRKRPGRTQTT